MHAAIATFIATAQDHPSWVLLIAGAVAFAESLAVVGTLVPAAIVMFTAGAVAGHGAVSITSLLACAAAGAVAGDALSYELGRAREPRFRASRLYGRHETALHRAQDILARHGAASVLLARFTGAVRAFVPLLAGFAHMPRARFYAVNIVSAALWAPAHILPGVVFGASLQLAEAVSGRLALLAALLVVIVWSAIWTATRLLGWLLPRVRRMRDGIVRVAQNRHGQLARIALDVLDPQRPGSHALLTGAVLLLGASWLFLGIVEDVLTHDPLVQADRSLFALLQSIRVPAADRVMIAMTEMGSVGVMLPLTLVVLAWLLWRRSWRTGGYWLAAVGFSELLVQVLKWTLGRHRPLALYTGNEAFSFPSGHATVSTVALGFIAFLLARRQGTRWRLTVVALAAAYVALVATSRLYLGAHWLSDVAGGMSFGFAWVALLAMVYTRRGVDEDYAPRSLAAVIVGTIIIAGALWMHWQGAADARLYAPAAGPAPTTIRLNDWHADGWRELPQYRAELAGDREEALPLQWACDEARLRATLRTNGWQAPAQWSFEAVLGLLAPRSALVTMPVVPRWNAGHASRIVLVRPAPNAPDDRDVIHLWRSAFDAIDTGGVRLPLWYGAVYRQQRRSPGSMLLEQEALDAPATRRALALSTDRPTLSGVDRDLPVLLSCAAVG